jgi:hypothetical protein
MFRKSAKNQKFPERTEEEIEILSAAILTAAADVLA